MGIYDVDKSGDTERMRMRGSGRIAGSSAVGADGEVCVMRFISKAMMSTRGRQDRDRRLAAERFGNGSY